MHRAFVTLLLLCTSFVFAAEPDVNQIIQRSVAANQVNFKAAPEFNHKERDRTSSGTKTYQITMIDGSPYQRLIAINSKPLSQSQEADERGKQEQARKARSAESDSDRQKRIAKYQSGRQRDNQMMNQLTVAFDFSYLGEGEVRGFAVWMLKATPRAGYKPPNMETQVLPGMQGELWIDQQTYNWVRVTARVIHPVSIEGFLAQVEPGTRFELENSPVGSGVWEASHFSEKSQAKVLFLINRASQDEETYYDYERASAR